MPSTPNFAYLLENNEPPPDPALQEASELHAIATKDVLQVDAEIQRLQEKKAAIQKSIDSYTIMLSPMRRLPTDILREIFYRCLHSTRNPIISATEAPMLLTRVCSLWRSVALTSPNIWAALHIPHPGHPQISPNYEHFTEHWEDFHLTFSEMMARRCQVVKQWLERSGSCFLSLSISYPPYGLSGAEIESDIFMDEIFQILVSSIQRWRRLDLSMPFSIHKLLQAKIPSKAMLSNLKALRVAESPIHPHSKGRSPLLVLEAPNLRVLSLHAPSLTRDSSKLVPRTGWGRLTDLCFDSPVDHKDILLLLKACPCLINFQIQIRGPFNAVPDSASGIVVCLPHLEKLKIFDFSSPSSPVLRSIRAPSLTFFQYQNFDTSFQTLQSGTPATMKWFIGNSSSTLKTLAIRSIAFHREVALSILRLGVGITQLHIGWFPLARLFEKHDEPAGDFPGKSIDLLFLKDDDSTSKLGVLLPNLEILEVDDVCNTRDDELLQLFKSRIDASARGDASPLKRVKLHLPRKEQKHIAEDIMMYARSAGLNLKFEVTYPPVPPEPRYIRHLSSSFLLPDPLSLDPFSLSRDSEKMRVHPIRSAGSQSYLVR